MSRKLAKVHFENDGGFTVRPTKECLDAVLDIMDKIEAKEAEGFSEEDAIQAILDPKGRKSGETSDE